jgi:glutaredoxin 3
MKAIRIYTKDYCPYCDAAKNLLSAKGAKFEEIDITRTPEVIHELVQKSGLMTVPQIFVGETCLGGYESITEMERRGTLKSALGV